MRPLIVPGLLLVFFVGPAIAADTPMAVSERAMYFRLVVGADDSLTVFGFIDESAGTGRGYDQAVLDLDSDGTPETVQKFTSDHVFVGRQGQGPRFSLRVIHDGGTYDLTIYGLGDADPQRADFHSSWSVHKDGVVLSFMSSRAPLHATFEEAQRGKPVRLGPPVEFEVRTRIEGPKAVLAVKLKGPMGGNLTGASRDGKPERIRVELIKREAVVAKGRPDYG